MTTCNDCETELKIENHKGICPNCGKIWNLTDDDSAIKSDGTVKIKNVRAAITPKLTIRKEVKHGVH